MAREERSFGGNVFGLRTADMPRGTSAPTLPPPTREAPLPPTQETPLTEAVIEGIIRTRKIDDQPKRRKSKLPLKLGLAGAGLVALAGGVWGLKTAIEASQNNTPEVHQIIPSKDSVYVDTGIEGEITRDNAVQMTAEEYKALEIPLIEKDGSVNLPITIVDRYGNPKNLHFKRGTGALGGLRNEAGENKYANNTMTITIKDMEIGDRFKANFKGAIWGSAGRKNSDGSITPGGYTMEGYDTDGNKVDLFIATVGNRELTKIPNSRDYTIVVRESPMKFTDGTTSMVKEWGIDPIMPKAEVDIGDDLWEYTTTKKDERYGHHIHMEALSSMFFNDNSYRGGAARINVPTTQDKAIVIK